MTLDYEAKQKIANQWWRKGTDALAKQNWDYAIDAFGRAIEQAGIKKTSPGGRTFYLGFKLKSGIHLVQPTGA